MNYELRITDTRHPELHRVQGLSPESRIVQYSPAPYVVQGGRVIFWVKSETFCC
jgi:hypothetical protein